MHIMNAMVASINAYQHYQKDVERSYHEIESSMASNKTHSHNQARTSPYRCLVLHVLPPRLVELLYT